MPRVLSPSLLERIVPGGGRILSAVMLEDGRRNSNFKLRIEGKESLVLRIFEHDLAFFRKEMDLFRVLGSSVPLPEVVRAEPDGLDDLPPFVLMRYVEGISFRELRRNGSDAAVAQAARSAGETLAAIGRTTFTKSGWIAPGPTVTTPLLEGADPVPRFVEQCLDSATAQARVPAEVRRRAIDWIWSGAAEIAPFDCETRLVHGDFNKRNLLVREEAGGWRVAAVLDWEFAVSGSPLMDMGNLLRYERDGRSRVTPHFAAGYADAAGPLPPNWRRLARLIDGAALAAILADPTTPAAIVEEVAGLLHESTDETAAGA